jgi:UDP-N-acetylmuramate--alanine ligase
MSPPPGPAEALHGRRFHFSGVAGSGMAPLAQLTVALGASVTGSDRSLDRGVALAVFRTLRDAGVILVPQDGSGVQAGIDALVYSSAVESTNPDFERALAAGVPRVRRGSFLAALAGARRTLAIAGTSGKSTVSAMTAHILVRAGLDPWFLGGGAAVDLPGATAPGSMRVGGSDWFVVETDESDGSVSEFEPAISTLLNLSRDHKEIEETASHFGRLLDRTREGAVVHVGDPELARVPLPQRIPVLKVALEGSPVWTSPDLVARQVRLDPASVHFTLEGVGVTLPFPGAFMAENVLLAIASAMAAGVPLPAAAEAVASFAGVRRRLERVGARGGVDVYDDFAHNPVKIRAALDALRPEGRLWVYYQPHGFGPTRFFAAQLVEAFRLGLRREDRLLLAPIYDAGGTADRTIRSENIAAPLLAAGVSVEVSDTRPRAIDRLATEVRPGDRVVVMGARDDTLSQFARTLLEALPARPASAAQTARP